MNSRPRRISLTVNREECFVEVSSQTKLAAVLRQDLGLTGSKIGCGEGRCGACVVLLDGRPVRACVYPASRVEGREIVTIEGLAATYGDPVELHPLQKAFVEHGAVQCGFCSPGQIMSAAGLWDKVLNDDGAEMPIEEEIKHALARNACRCTGYASILRAVRSAFHEQLTGEPLKPTEADRDSKFELVGHSFPRPDAADRVTGTAVFADDYIFPGMLFGATLRAGRPHACIVSIDTSRAEALPGVEAVLTHDDVPGLNRHGLIYQDWPVLCAEKVRYVGDAVAIVAAESAETAREAVDLIEVTYEDLPVVDSPDRAQESDAAIVHEQWETGNLLKQIKVRHGDVEKGFAEADVIVENEYRTPTCDHMFMEPECSIGVPDGYDDDHEKLTVYVGSQIPYADRDQVAAAVALEPEEVRIRGTIIGGGFGGKEDIMGQIHAALLAEKTGRPVKILYDRSESLLAHPKRHATTIRIKTGATKDGTLTAVQAEILGDGGAYASLSDKVMARCATHATGPYAVPNAKIDCFVTYTNNPPAGAFRGFGVTQSAFAAEQNMDILAHELGMDPIELRRKNALRVGSVTATGQILRSSVNLVECLDWVEAKVNELRAIPVPECDLASPRIGWGVAAAYKNTGLGQGATDAAEVWLGVHEDGTVEVRSSSADLGQGLATVLAQFAAEVLGVPMSRVQVRLSDTDLAPDGGPTTASRQTYVTGNAVRLAAEAMRDRLALVAASRWNTLHSRVRFEDGQLRAECRSVSFAEAVRWLDDVGGDLTVRYRYEAPATTPLGDGGDMHFAFSFGVQAAQVAVSQETGEVRVLRVVAAADGGRPINPQAFRGQIEGGIVMGIGTALTEVYEVEKAIPQTVRWADYDIPFIDRMPEMHLHLVHSPTPEGPYGAKGIGELPSIPTAPAVCNAIHEAVSVRIKELPARPDRVLRGVCALR